MDNLTDYGVVLVGQYRNTYCIDNLWTLPCNSSVYAIPLSTSQLIEVLMTVH